MDPFFHFPIFYDSDKRQVKNEIIVDLELVELLEKEDSEPEIRNEEEKESFHPLDSVLTKEGKKKSSSESESSSSDCQSNKPIYHKIFQPQDEFETENMFHEAVKYYTTNVSFLQENQQFLKSYVASNAHLYDISLFPSFVSPNPTDKLSTGGNPYLKEEELKQAKRVLMKAYKEIEEMFQETKDSYFLHKYGMIDYSFFQQLNEYDIVLQCLSVYNLLSPLLSVVIPLVMFLVPLYVLKFQLGVEFSMESYLDVLKNIGGNQPLIRFITGIKDATNEKRFYMLATMAFYAYSVYKSWMDCIRFYKSLQKMHFFLVNLQGYVELTLRRMRHVVSFCHMLPSFDIFNRVLAKNINSLMDLQTLISSVKPFKWNSTTFFQLGYTMKCFYQVYQKQDIRDALIYSFGFHGFFHITETIKRKIQKKEISFVSSFVNPNLTKEGEEEEDSPKELTESTNTSKTSNTTKTKEEEEENDDEESHRETCSPTLAFHNSYYAGLFSPTGGHLENIQRNDIVLDKHWIITGPNASGKTTLIKSVIINLLFSQHFGCGFYDSAELTPFHSIFCYLNVPDTSGRDSLFQAEARRCKQIIDYIQTNPDKYHFGIFDELYSGTNPEEAAESSFCFMRFLSSFPSVKSMLTTHFIEVCHQLQKDEKASSKISLKHMLVEKKSKQETLNNRHFSVSPFRYLYKIKDGISNVKGAFVILNELNYPKELLNLYKREEEENEENEKEEEENEQNKDDGENEREK